MDNEEQQPPPLPCIVCGFQPKNAFGRHARPQDINQPYQAIVFTSHGQYGSTLFDEMDGSFLELNVCDDCVKAAAVQQRVLIGRKKHVPTTYDYEVFDVEGFLARFEA